MKFAALIVAAGRGTRAGGEIPKQYSSIGGRPALRWSVYAFLAAGAEEIVVVHGVGQEALCRTATGGLPVRCVAGGETRSASVRAGLAALQSDAVVLIHDAARPGVTASQINKLVEAISAGADGAAPALRVADSLRRADEDGFVFQEIDREGAMVVQTPQAFRLPLIRAAYAAAGDLSLSDDIAIARRIGARVKLIAGDVRLMKLTYAGDAAILERLMSTRVTCVGSGYDAHRFGPGDHVMLCGVRIAHEKGLVGHSDADAGWHALVDAILGALGEGDIGAHFPPSEAQWKGASSEAFLAHAADIVAGAGARITHVDVTLICERPKISAHREAMRAETARVLRLPVSRVSIKATTTEKMGFTGREEGLAAQAVATLERPVAD